MTEVLSQDEIDQLLTAISAGDTETEDFRPVNDTRKIKIYDFKRPDKFSKEQIRTVSIMHETFARLTTTALSAQLRSMAHVHVASVDQLTYEEFIRSIPTPTTLAVINMDPLKGNAILEIDPSVTFSIIDRLFGGTGQGTKVQRDLNGLVEFGLREFGQNLGRFLQRVFFRQVSDLEGAAVTFALFFHYCSLRCMRPGQGLPR